jgi:tryptophan synthase alpha chain
MPMKLHENRITLTLQRLKEQKEKALVCFLTAGFPQLDSTVPLVHTLEQGGADIIEIGMPFSDPLAEGPVIQESSLVALNNGVTLDLILEQVKEIRKRSQIPLILMGYLNPILTYGAEKFFSAAAASGVDGLILPELPLEESNRFRTLMEHHGLAAILLVAPTTPKDRIRNIDAASEGFLYCVSMTGVTGATNTTDTVQHIRLVKSCAKKNPVLVGFGIKTPEDAKQMSLLADGVIIGSRIVQILQQTQGEAQLLAYIQSIKQAIR